MYLKSYPLCLIFLACTIFANGQDYIPTIQIQAQEVARAMLHNDFGKMADKTYPDVMSMSGGREAMIQAMEAQMEQLQAQKISFRKVDIGMPGAVVRAEEELHCLIPLTIVMELPNGTLTTNGHLLGISANQGESWYFIDTAMLDNDNIKTIVPHYNPSLKIPQRQAPVFERAGKKE